MLDENDIQRLLRLKRYEQPPAGYHERFVQEFRRRQRAEAPRQAVWRTALERIGAFFSDSGMGRLAYGSATLAVLLCAGGATYRMVSAGGTSNSNGTGNVAGNSWATEPKVAIVDPSPIVTVHAQPASDVALPLGGHPNVLLPSPDLPQLQTAPAADPHYILESRPRSYEHDERPFSF
ncbi:MAG TPA: hypothetical protein VG733_13530 [Chthoniobacteraceae bacterium]|nr:hypothetical protein [Chthoniobacteraceae bacterium]